MQYNIITAEYHVLLICFNGLYTNILLLPLQDVSSLRTVVCGFVLYASAKLPFYANLMDDKEI